MFDRGDALRLKGAPVIGLPGATGTHIVATEALELVPGPAGAPPLRDGDTLLGAGALPATCQA